MNAMTVKNGVLIDGVLYSFREAARVIVNRKWSARSHG